MALTFAAGKPPTEVAFSYALSLTQEFGKLANMEASGMSAALLNLVQYDANGLSKYIDATQSAVFAMKKQAFTPLELTYVPSAGQYMVNGQHLTLKVSKAHGGLLVYTVSGYWGALASPKLAPIAEALNTAEKAQTACIAYAKATGKCGVCNTKLKDPKSIADGIGPVCKKKFA
jgi:hypothetical protein